jgi:hypothetical protein
MLSWIVDVHRNDRRLSLRTPMRNRRAFLELEGAIHKIIALGQPRDNPAQFFPASAVYGCAFREKRGVVQW